MRINVKIYSPTRSGSGIDCLDEKCRYRKECANHRTAGDFRCEGGFTPDLFEENNVFFCRTKTLKPDDTYEDFPSNHKTCGTGMLIFKEGEIKHFESENVE
jgi:hypothetical protein